MLALPLDVTGHVIQVHDDALSASWTHTALIELGNFAHVVGGFDGSRFFSSLDLLLSIRDKTGCLGPDLLLVSRVCRIDSLHEVFVIVPPETTRLDMIDKLLYEPSHFGHRIVGRFFAETLDLDLESVVACIDVFLEPRKPG